MVECFDIAVIGAGPAGSMAAMSAVAPNVKVCLIERKSEAGTPVRCGEGIGYKGLTSYIEPRPEWLKSRIKKSKMISPSGVEVNILNVEESYILDREKMDSDLVKTAERAGVSFFSNTSINNIKINSDKTYQIISSKTQFKSKIVILADGVESRLARCLGWNTTLELKDVETCAFARVVSPLIEKDTCVFYTGSRIAPGGYAWVFPRGKGEANVGLGISGLNSSAGKARELLDKFIENEFPAARVYNYHCGGVPAARYLKPLVKEGVMVVGDAARQVNAVSGAGISYSLFAGKTAGTAAKEAVQSSKESIDYKLLKKYEQIWSKKYGKQQQRSFALKEFLAKNGNDTFLNRIAESLSKENPEKINYLRVFLKTFAGNPLLLYKAFRLFK